MIQGLKGIPISIIAALGIPCFALLNALAEEIVYRGVMQEALERVIPYSSLAILFQALAFAALHFAVGFPNGMVGFAMVATYGLALGYLRHRTSGMLAPYLTHVLADLTIGYFLLWKFL